MIRVAALTSGRNMPSSRFRVRQYIGPLRKEGIDVCEYVPAIHKYANFRRIPGDVNPKYMRPVFAMLIGAKLATRVPGIIGSWKAQITWLEREMLPGYFTLEFLIRCPYVFDVDDAIWLTPPFGRSAVIKIANRAEVVLAGNTYIADWFSSQARDIRVVPTGIDTERFTPRSRTDIENNKHFVVGWTGLSSNFIYIYEIERALEDFLKNHEAKLLVVADQSPSFSRLNPKWVQYIKWSPAVETQAVQQMDVGLMPLPDDDWSRGKCSFKMLQYMASGVPVVVSPVGMNAEILSMGKVGFPAKDEADWYDALDQLYKDRDLGHKCGATGRLIVEQRFSRAVISTNIAQVFKELA